MEIGSVMFGLTTRIVSYFSGEGLFYAVCIGYILRCRFLHDLHDRGRRPRLM